MIITGYKFGTLSEAESAMEQCNTYYGIPAGPDDVTRNWVEYETAVFNDPIFYYFIADESLLPILGQPYSFEVISDL